MAVGMSSCHNVFSFGERAIIKIGEILFPQRAVMVSRTALIGEEEIFRIGI
jgi:hypothetical protein